MNDERDNYYLSEYKKLQRQGLQGWGNSLIDRLIETKVNRKSGMKIIELGASSGEHLRYVSTEPKWQEYVALDIRPGISDPQLYLDITKNSKEFFPNVSFIEGDAEDIPFNDNEFDLAIATCLLAHVRNPERVLLEMRRVVSPGGQIVVAMPTDPGAMNRLVKNFVTYPKMKNMGIENPRLEYAREHINGIGNLIELIKNCFTEDDIVLNYFPFHIPSWNLNLAIVLDCKLRK